MTFLDTTGATVATRQVNVGYREYVPVFYVSDPITTLTHTFPAGPAMISFPIRPLKSKAAEALLNPTTLQPLFNDNNLLMARWQQNLNRTDGDNYQRYPIMDPIEPGKGYWSSFPSAVPIAIQGRGTSQDPQVSQGLQHGWNQIGNPFTTAIPISGLQFQYLADNIPVDLATAIGRGWIVTKQIGTTAVSVWEFNPATGYQPATTLEPWKGYWIRVLVSEGLTITYNNPAGRAVKLKSRSASVSAPMAKGWAIPLQLRGSDGVGATAWLGQADEATSGYNEKFDAQRPPEFSRSVPTISFEHPEWGANGGRFYSDIRSSGSRDAWEVSVFTPQPNKTYTLSWSDLTGVPRNTRLILVDPATGHRQYLQSTSSYSFSSGSTATRKFRIEPENRSAGALQVLNLAARVTRGVGASTVEIGFDLNQSATVSTEIRGVDGRVIRRLSSGRAATAGTSTLVWDTRDDRAVSVPSGSYMVQITARTPEGESARSFRMITLVR
jgi:hypothetical protein